MDSIKNFPEGETWKIGDKDMPVVEQPTHMGIPRSSLNQDMHAVKNIQKAQPTMYSLMGAGLHGEMDLTLKQPSPYCKHMCFRSYIMEWKL